MLTATVLGCPPWPFICPRRAVLVATRPWHRESYSGGPSRSPEPCPLATALPSRTHCQPWAERAGGRQSSHLDSRTDQGSQSVAWWLSRSPRSLACPATQRARSQHGCCGHHHGEAPSPVPVPRGLGHPGCGQVSLPLTSPRPPVPWIFSNPTPLPPRFFRRLDQDGSRSLDVRELQRGLAELGLVLDTAEMEGVCRRWDRDGSGTLDLEEFLRALRVSRGCSSVPSSHWGAALSRACLCQRGDQWEPLRFVPPSHHHTLPSPPCPRPGRRSSQLRLPSWTAVVMAW